MKKRKNSQKIGKSRFPGKPQRRLSMQDLEARLLLASDVVLGPGTSEPRVVVPAEIRINEVETDSRDTERNDSALAAELLPLGFGTGEFAAIDIRGELIEPIGIGQARNREIEDANAVPPIPAIEDGSIPLANPVNHQAGSPIQYPGVIGDSPGGHVDGDYYELEDVDAGQRIFAHVQTTAILAIVLYDEVGRVMETSDSANPFGLINNQPDFDPFVSFVVPEDGDYYVAIVPYTGSSSTFVTPTNPTDVRFVQPGAADGPYVLTIGVDAVDIDYFAVDLQPGDILGVNGIGAANLLSVFTPDQSLMLRSGQQWNPTFYPPSSPLPRTTPSGGSANVGYVANTAGVHYVGVEGYNWSKYLLELRLFRPAIESAPPGQQQILYLDFDGAKINPQVFGPENSNELRTLSGMRSFMSRWGLRDESDLIDRIIKVVDQDLNGDLQRLNGEAGVKILNSRDHGDPYGQPYVSRIIVGGTTDQATIEGVIGLANSIDVGNFDMEETAFVLLDLLSGPLDDPNSLNVYDVAPGANKADLVAAGVGGVISHEAGHFFGAYHTDSGNQVDSIMDAGGALERLVGVGDDWIWGTSDDVDVKFVNDEFSQEEGFVGVENVPGNFANVLVRGKGASSVEGGNRLTGVVFNDENGNGVQDDNEAGLGDTIVYVDNNGDQEFGIGEPSTTSADSGVFVIPNATIGQNGVLRVVVAPGLQLTAPAESGFPISNTVEASYSFGLQGVSGVNAGTDFGDAPDSYGLASHQIVAGLSLGAAIDGELGTSQDDGADDDGVTLANLVAGQTGTGTVTTTHGNFSPGVVTGWIDFDGDGIFTSSEQVVKDLLVDDTGSFTFGVPAASVAGTTWARFRFGYQRNIAPTGHAAVGEVEDYPVRIVGGNGNGTGGTISTGPTAVADTFTVAPDASIALNVLSNDAAGSGTLAISSVGTTSQGGTAVISQDGQTIVYAPANGFSGTESFSYTVSTAFGDSTANVSVVINDDGSGEDLVRFRLETTNAAGLPITTIEAGEDFVFNVYADDLRDGGNGVFAGYVDVEFDSDLATPNGNVTFGDNYPAGQVPSLGIPGITNGEFDEYGAFAGITNQLGNEELLLYSVTMTATSNGVLTIASNPADVSPVHDVLLGDIEQGIPTDRIDYGSTTLVIGEITANTNPANPLDVNNDGFVAPNDALVLINDINRAGARTLSASSNQISNSFYLDVNRDGSLSAADVLNIVNFLNNGGAAEPPTADAAAVATASTDAVFADFNSDLDDDDEADALSSMIV